MKHNLSKVIAVALLSSFVSAASVAQPPAATAPVAKPAAKSEQESPEVAAIRAVGGVRGCIQQT